MPSRGRIFVSPSFRSTASLTSWVLFLVAAWPPEPDAAPALRVLARPASVQRASEQLQGVEQTRQDEPRVQACQAPPALVWLRTVDDQPGGDSSRPQGVKQARQDEPRVQAFQAPPVLFWPRAADEPLAGDSA